MVSSLPIMLVVVKSMLALRRSFLERFDWYFRTIRISVGIAPWSISRAACIISMLFV